MGGAAPSAGHPRRRRWLKITLRLLLGLLILLILLIGATLWRLASGPLDIGFLTPRLETVFAEALEGYSLDIGETVLHWNRERDTLDLRARDLAVIGPAGAELARVPEVGLKLDLGALLHRVIAVSEMRVDGGWLILRRVVDGRVRFGLAVGSEDRLASIVGLAPEIEPAPETAAEAPPAPAGDVIAEPADTTATPVIEAILAALVAAPDRERPITYLEKFELTRASLEMNDNRLGVRWAVADASLDLQRGPGGLAGRLEFALPLEDHTATVTTALHYDVVAGSVRVEGRVTDLWLPDLGAVVGSDLLETVTILASGSGHATFGSDGRIEEGSLELSGRLAGAVNETARVTVAAEATVADDDLGIAATLVLVDFPLVRLASHWPEFLAPGARLWVTRNVVAGLVSSARADADLHLPDGLVGDITLERLEGTLAYRDLEIHYLRPLEPVRGLTGEATFDADGFRFVAGKAALADLEVDSIRVRISGLSAGKDALDGGVRLAGPVRTILEQLDSPPLGLLAGVGIDPARAAGDVDSRASFGLPLRGAITIAGVDLDFRGQLSGARVDALIAGHDVTDASLEFAVTGRGMRFAGPLGFAGIPVRIDYEEAFGGEVAERRRLALATDRLDESGLAKLGLDLGDWVAGPLSLRAAGVQAPDGSGRLRLDLDLSAASLAIAPLGWRKEVGVAGEIAAGIALEDGRPVRVDSLRIVAGDLQTEGRVDFASTPERSLRIEANHLRLGRTDLTTVVLARRDAVWHLDVGGGVVDLAPLKGGTDEESEEDDEAPEEAPAIESGAAVADDGDPAPAVPERPERPEPATAFTCRTGRLDRIWFGVDRYLAGVEIDFERGTDGWRRARITGRVPAVPSASGDPAVPAAADTPISLSYGPRGGIDSLYVDVTDLGALLDATGLAEEFAGGRLTMRGASLEPGRIHPLRVQLDLDAWRLTGDSRTVKMLAFSPIRDLFSGAEEEGLAFETLDATLEWQPGELGITSLEAAGPTISFTLKGPLDYGADSVDLRGSVVPLRGVNTVLGAIPLVGNIFSKGEGFMATDFTVTGALSDPQIDVKTLSTVTPSFLKSNDD